MNFLLVSHGPLAASALESVEMIMGQQENVRTLSVTHDTTLEGMEQEIADVYNEFSSDEMFIFCDILGGTPFNASVRFKMNHPQVEVITGFNLPVLIETFMMRDLPREELLEVVRNTYANGMEIVKEVASTEIDETEMMNL